MRSLLLLLFFLPWAATYAQVKDPPPVNRKVLEFVDRNMGVTVGRGECWDLAAEALDHADAQWDGAWKFGRPVDPVKEEVLPGDIVRFRNVLTRHRSGTMQREERMADHTAVIHQVHDRGIYTLAHQNTDVSGRKVGVSRFLLEHVVRGKVEFFRPVPRS
jgi:hypothetical protein